MSLIVRLAIEYLFGGALAWLTARGIAWLKGAR
jgi:hypothetical protein